MAGRKHPFIPEFHSEDEEREFWDQVDVAKFIECPTDEIVLELRSKRGRRKKVAPEWIDLLTCGKITTSLQEDLFVSLNLHL
ncbi:hypothetical protein [Fervidibacter sp.]|jgi:hypothetical protein